MFPYEIRPASSKTGLKPIVASIPHAGTFLPLDIERRFADHLQLKLPMTDWYLQYLYDFLPKLGISVIYGNISRNTIDLNRSPVPMNLYAGRVETKLVADKNFYDQEIFAQYPTETQVEHYKTTVHEPYHRALNNLLADRIKQFGQVYLFDLHSIAPFATVNHPYLESDIYLGNRDHQSCTQALLDLVDRLFQNCGFTTKINDPYKGGYITHHYGQLDNVHALQIEMNQSVYLEGHERPKNNEDLSMILTDRVFRSAKRKIEIMFSTLLVSLKGV